MEIPTVESAPVLVTNSTKNKKSSWKIENLPIIENSENSSSFSDENQENDQNQMNELPDDLESIEIVFDSNDGFTEVLDVNPEYSSSNQDDLFKTFFRNIKVTGKRISADCATCKKSYKADISSKSNLTGHLKVKIHF